MSWDLTEKKKEDSIITNNWGLLFQVVLEQQFIMCGSDFLWNIDYSDNLIKLFLNLVQIPFQIH